MNGFSQAVRDRALKLAARELVASVGGQEAAASITGKSQSQIQRCCSLHDETSYLNMRDAALLEQYAGRPMVTMEMAKQAGGVFLGLPDPSVDDDEIAMRVMQLAEELGDVSSGVRRALKDGQVDEREAADIERELDEVIEAAIAARGVVQRMQGAKRGAVVKIQEGMRG